MDRIDSSEHTRKWCPATNVKVLCWHGSCQEWWKDVGGVLVKEVPEACREGSQSVVSFWRAHYPTTHRPAPKSTKNPLPSLTVSLSLRLPPSQTQPWTKAKMGILSACPRRTPRPLPYCLGLSPTLLPSGLTRFLEAPFTPEGELKSLNYLLQSHKHLHSISSSC